ncbi:MAG: hypothetical protein QOD99_1082 [Chthoniobacter sp.]|jgi:galactose mutarotase-like enzyme|nr:hypothetical protein [Chthoniobacter sp.]
MRFQYQELERDGQTLDVLTDGASGLRIAVSRRGAELVSLARREANGEWIGFLHRDSEVCPALSGWGNHATVMGYYIHRLKNGRTSYRGQEIRGGTHSFLRHKEFAPPRFAGDDSASLTYRITPEQLARDEYPLRVALTLRYAIADDALTVSFQFVNEEPELTAHVSFGLHPGFTAASLESADVLMPEGDYIRHLAPGDLLSGDTETFHHAGGPMPFKKSDLPGSFLLELKNVAEAKFAFVDNSSGRRVNLGFSEAPYITIWSSGEPFICVEPCWGLPDHHNQRPFEQKLGIQPIKPGTTLTRSCTISPILP